MFSPVYVTCVEISYSKLREKASNREKKNPLGIIVGSCVSVAKGSLFSQIHSISQGDHMYSYVINHLLQIFVLTWDMKWLQLFCIRHKDDACSALLTI